MVTFKQTLLNLSADYKRAALLQGRQHGVFNKLYVAIQSGFVIALCYRLSRYCYYNKLRFMCRLFDAITFFYATAEIDPQADIGPGLVFDGKLFGISNVVTIGENCTLLGRNTLALGAMENTEIANEKITIGDYCVFGYGSKVIRPVKLEAGTQVAPNSVVMLTEARTGATLSGIPAKRRRTDDVASIVSWNPLLGTKLYPEN